MADCERDWWLLGLIAQAKWARRPAVVVPSPIHPLGQIV